MAQKKTQSPVRRLAVVLGDQLDPHSTVLDDLDSKKDAVWMAEVAEEVSHVRCHQLRIAFYFSAMRHFREELEAEGYAVHYTTLPEDGRKDRGHSFEEVLSADLKDLKPESVRVVRPGDYRVTRQLEAACAAADVPLEIVEDGHFFSTPEEFAEFAEGRKALVMETFYRQMRKRHGILMESNSKPTGGDWNFDAANRESFGKEGPGELPEFPRYKKDAIVSEVLNLVKARFADNPGSAAEIDRIPVRRKHAKEFLERFIAERLPDFGTYEDAMWSGERFLYHSRLSVLLNVKLLDARTVVNEAVAAYEDGAAPINAVEGFVRQILGWREFMRGIYWLKMPDYAEMNALKHTEALPEFFWTGDTEMACLRDCLDGVLEHGYAHHIPRLMVMGLFAQLYGAHPYAFHEWHMAMYLDAIDWVSLPNTLGMSQYGDGGIVGSKPYCASGNYIQRMSNYCKSCRYKPTVATGEAACPFTTLYWDFLDRHKADFKSNRRMQFQLKNLDRKAGKEMTAIREQAKSLRTSLGGKN